VGNYNRPGTPDTLKQWHAATESFRGMMAAAGITQLEPTLEVTLKTSSNGFRAVVRTNMNRLLDEFHPANTYLNFQGIGEGKSADLAVQGALRAYLEGLN
jgi:hypothetical protein